jgi:hypothetical protein
MGFDGMDDLRCAALTMLMTAVSLAVAYLAKK